MAGTIGVDVGGTKIASAWVDESGRHAEPVVRATPTDDYEQLLTALADVVRKVGTGVGAEGVGLAIAGNVRKDGSAVLFSPHLPLADQPLCEHLATATGLPVLVVNDADAAAWAEYRFGGHTPAGDGDDLLMVALGTGLGSGLILDGRLYRGAHGFAGEAGHVPVVRDGRPCPCGSRGCWERYASGTALNQAFLAAGGDPAVRGPAITAAALAGDPAAQAAFTEVGQWLGHGLAGMVDVLDPGVVVVGGGLVEAGELLLAPARETLAATVTGGGRRPVPPLSPARLGNDAGLVGAASLASEHVA